MNELFQKNHLRGLTFFRIGISLTLLSLLVGILPYSDFLFSDKGPNTFSSTAVYTLNFDYQVILYLCLLSSIFLLVGIKQALASVLVLFSLIVLLHRNPYFAWGNIHLLLILILTLSWFLFEERTLSYQKSNSFSRTKQNKQDLFISLVAINIPLVYLITNLHRISSSSWLNANAALYALKNSSFSYLSAYSWESHITFLKVLTWLVVFLELFAIIALFIPKKYGRIIIALAIVMHICFMLTLNVQNWQSLMIVLLIFGLYHIHDFQSSLRRMISFVYPKNTIIFLLYFITMLHSGLPPRLIGEHNFSASKNIGKVFSAFTKISGASAYTMFQESEPELETCYSLEYQDEENLWRMVTQKAESDCSNDLKSFPGNEKNLYFRRLIKWNNLKNSNFSQQNEFALSLCNYLSKNKINAQGVRLRKVKVTFNLTSQGGTLQINKPKHETLINLPCYNPI